MLTLPFPTIDPVLVELGSTRERASFILERFEIAVRGLAASEGQAYGPELLAELWERPDAVRRVSR